MGFNIMCKDERVTQLEQICTLKFEKHVKQLREPKKVQTFKADKMVGGSYKDKGV